VYVFDLYFKALEVVCLNILKSGVEVAQLGPLYGSRDMFVFFDAETRTL